MRMRLKYLGTELEDNDGEQDETCINQGKIVNDLLHILNVHEPMWLDGIHPEVLEELAEVFTKLLSIS